MDNIELVIAPREKDLGGFTVRRVLPYATHRMVGPFIFFDHMGPHTFSRDEGMDVRPHPHIGLATVTYLFEGSIRHRDSLGSDQVIVPGDINWMTAGSGIVHSERTPTGLRKSGGKIEGIQVWVALPSEQEETEPSFVHHPSSSLPEFEIDNTKIKLLIGTIWNRKSPVKTFSDVFYLDINMPEGTSLVVPAHGEAAVYLLSGEIYVDDKVVSPHTMAVIKKCQNINLRAAGQSRLLIIGGEPVGERFIYWNFVSSSKEKLDVAKKNWSNGPDGIQFKKIPLDDQEYIPLPGDLTNPKGTPL